MGFYEVVLNTQYLEQKFVNRWNYFAEEDFPTSQGAFGLIQALGLYASGSPANFPVGTMGAAIQALLNEQVIFVQAYAKNIYNPFDFYDYAFPDDVVGGVAGAGISPVLAIGFTSSRTRTDIRRGQKRFGGIDGDWVTNGGALSATAITAANTLAARMSEDVEFDTGIGIFEYKPCIASKKKPSEVPLSDGYEYWPTEDEQFGHSMFNIVWSVKDDIRTQGSRQYGRGQ